MKFGHLTYQEIKEAAQSDWIVLVPTGCTEQQGPHLPIDFDTWFAEKVCNEVSKKAYEDFDINSVVLPVIPYGPTPEHTGIGAGYINLPQNLHEKVYKAVLQSLVEQGFRRIIIWTGCGQHQLDSMVHEFQQKMNNLVNIYIPPKPYQQVWEQIGDPTIPGGHADMFTTSIALALRPNDVQRDRIKNPEYTVPNWDDPNLDLSKFTNTGSIGEITESSADLGMKLWESIVEKSSQILFEFNQRTNGQGSNNKAP